VIHWAQQFCVCDYDSPNINGGVTDLTVSTEVAAVRVAMTLDATMTAHRESQIQLSDWRVFPISNTQGPSPSGSGLMTQGARRLPVRATPGEFRHRVVVELGCALLGPMALATVPAQLAAVLVVLLVTVVTAVLVELVYVVLMTCLARQSLVLALEFEGRVIEVLNMWIFKTPKWRMAL
jgi:hypothetical protein